MVIAVFQTLVHFSPWTGECSAAGETRNPRENNGQKIDTDPDASPPTPKDISRYLSVGGYLELDSKLERNFDLDGSEKDSLAIVEPILSVAARIEPIESVQAYINVRFAEEVDVKEQGKNDKDRDGKLKISQAYFSVEDIFEDSTLTVGRQRLHDDREWLYDENLDAVRLQYDLPKTRFDLALSWEGVLDDDLLNDGDDDRIDNVMFRVEHDLTRDVQFAPFVVYRYARTGEWERPLFLGFQSAGEVVKNLQYWQALSWVRGKEKEIEKKTGSSRIFRFDGIGLDLGARYEFDARYDPSVVLGFAFGSGDRDSDTAGRRGFRQTGLQDNSGKLNGIPSVQYYGELFDPELSNLMVFTLGSGLRPTRNASVELICHYFRQHRASDELRDTDIDADPDGENEVLGSEIDLVAGLRYAKFYVEANLGAFMPGNAFQGETDSPAILAQVKLRYKF